MRYQLAEKMMSMVFQDVQARFTGGRRSINPHLSSHPTLISFLSDVCSCCSGHAQEVNLQLTWRERLPCVNHRGWSEVTRPESSPQDKVGGSNEHIRCQHAVAFWSERLVWKLEASALHARTHREGKNTNCRCHLPDQGCNRIKTTMTLSGSDYGPILRF